MVSYVKKLKKIYPPQRRYKKPSPKGLNTTTTTKNYNKMTNYKQPRLNKLISLFTKHNVMEDRFIQMWKGMTTKQLDNLIVKMDNLK